ncbi:LysR family transcriptional regulator [Salinarimonas ramus]|uniref:LysR family transcriptional regulator n=1 Tax=Salinarimonas ramus TaxID=690164 RepID=A0A917QCF3_9HYPH|nr:LysR family transcriptional regulator [Salinarimonas ramus]GGK43366.1 LysR family transcriptional regulator [Salinarimonas ramus]
MARNLDTALLRAFVAVAETGGMTAAGTVLNLTQAAVSQQIKRLEDSFGAQLFERERRGLALTAQGERLLGLAKRLLAMNDQIWAEMTAPVETGEIRLGIPYDLVPGFVAPVLRRFARCCPRVRVRLLSHASRDIKGAFERGEIDLGIVEEPTTDPHGETLMIDRLVWVGAEGGDAYLQRPVPISIGSESCSIRAPALAALRAADIDWRPVAEIANVDALNATVQSDLAVTTMLACAVPPGLEILPPDSGLPHVPPLAVSLYLRRDHGSRAVDDLARILREAFCRRPAAAAA